MTRRRDLLDWIGWAAIIGLCYVLYLAVEAALAVLASPVTVLAAPVIAIAGGAVLLGGGLTRALLQRRRTVQTAEPPAAPPIRLYAMKPADPIGDRDRDHVVEHLCEQYEGGDIDWSQFVERMDKAFTATTAKDLWRVMRELPTT